MSGAYEFGEWVETPEGWRVCASPPVPGRPELYRWRSGEVCTIPELIDPDEDRRVREAPLPPEPTLRYITVGPM